jgi:hypothetical protein
MVSVFARLRFRTTALFLLAAAPGCITPSSFPFAHLYEKENGVMTPPVTTNPIITTTTPPLDRTTATTSWGSAFLDATFLDSLLSTHTVSHQLRSLLSPLLMPLWPPAVPAKVIFIEGQKNWTIATALVAILFDDRYNDLSTTAPYVDPCRITQYDLGFPLGLVVEYGGFLQSAYVPVCIPRVKNSCATFFACGDRYHCCAGRALLLRAGRALLLGQTGTSHVAIGTTAVLGGHCCCVLGGHCCWDKLGLLMWR